MFSLEDYCRLTANEATYYQYRLALCLFLESVYGLTPAGRTRTDGEIQTLDLLSLQYLTEERDHVRDILRFPKVLVTYSPVSQKSYFTTVVAWLSDNDIEVKKGVLKKIKRQLPAGKPITQDVSISSEDIRAWHEHLPQLGRAMLLVQVSSGIRIGELLAIRLEDIDLTCSPAEVQVKSHVQQYSGKPFKPKNGEDRTTFISTEATFAVKEWLKQRDAWLDTACSRTFSMTKNRDDNRVFPVGVVTAGSIYARGLEKAGLYQVDERSGRSRISSHSLRKFFMSQLKTAMPSEMVELLAGHAGYLSDSYRRYPLEQVRDAYRDAEYTISISQPAESVRANEKTIRSLTSKVIKQEQLLEQQMAQNEQILAASKLIQELRAELDKRNAAI